MLLLSIETLTSICSMGWISQRMDPPSSPLHEAERWGFTSTSEPAVILYLMVMGELANGHILTGRMSLEIGRPLTGTTQTTWVDSLL